ncbi:MAG: hypothetical protein COV46_03670 [Deltaproteobacteria bacterium CG11_big_fil_rev_8_21_14_0_20_49_13]|nr:MAG: hypothetical protein COV46_03670 [Deltaproteobacteria bacterium CG11_big_fil_rev_8_21_14_0_20_49_13]
MKNKKNKKGRKAKIASKASNASKASKGKEWGVNDFVDSVWGTMQEQAERNKHLKMLHAKLEPEWNKVVQSVSQMLEASNDAEVTKHVEEVCAHGERAVRPLIDIVLKLKSAVELFNKKSCDKTPNE